MVNGVEWQDQERWVLPREPRSAGQARRHVEAACPDLPPDQLDTARLLVTELVSNALRHGDGPVVLVLSRTREGLRVGVEDDGPSMPAVTHHPVLAQQGRGLQLVAGLASTWGVARRGEGQPGKQVWFDLG
jgi:anti-sigma regulatory factor (Ser/Thr protein kinase)